MAENSYPPFVPPLDINQQTPRQCCATQADDYMHWILDVLESRTEGVVAYFAESLPGRLENVEPFLRRIGTKAVDRL